MKTAHIVLEGMASGHALTGNHVRLYVRTDDGDKLQLSTTSVKLEVSARGLVKLQADLIPNEVDIDGIVRVELDETTPTS